MQHVKLADNSMAKELQENEVVTFGDFRITTDSDREGNRIIKINTDLGFMLVRPQSGNSIIVESTKSVK